jgi:hypothetical protein
VTYWQGLIYGPIAAALGLFGMIKLPKPSALRFAAMALFYFSSAAVMLAIVHLFILRR